MILEELNMCKETVTNFNNKFEHEKSVHQNGLKESISFWSKNKYIFQSFTRYFNECNDFCANNNLPIFWYRCI